MGRSNYFLCRIWFCLQKFVIYDLLFSCSKQTTTKKDNKITMTISNNKIITKLNQGHSNCMQFKFDCILIHIDHFCSLRMRKSYEHPFLCSFCLFSFFFFVFHSSRSHWFCFKQLWALKSNIAMLWQGFFSVAMQPKLSPVSRRAHALFLLCFFVQGWSFFLVGSVSLLILVISFCRFEVSFLTPSSFWDLQFVSVVQFFDVVSSRWHSALFLLLVVFWACLVLAGI